MKQSDKNKNIFSVYDSESPIATEFRRLYNNLKRYRTSTNKSILITSSNRGEGKSTIASHLALTIANISKKKILVIDSDIRRPKMHKIFNVARENGLCECLRDSVDPMKAVKKTEQENLFILTAGDRTDSPSSLFESEAISSIFEKVKFYYDFIIVDSAPVLAISDTLFVCEEVSKVVLVVMAGVTPREIVSRTKEILVDSNAEILGVVLNNAMEVLPYYYDYKYYEVDSYIEI